jgi:hypothetical protein
MLKAARQAADAEAAVAAQTAALRTEFGWFGESEQRKRIFTARRPVALTVWDAVKPRPEDGEAPLPRHLRISSVRLPNSSAGTKSSSARTISPFSIRRWKSFLLSSSKGSNDKK